MPPSLVDVVAKMRAAEAQRAARTAASAASAARSAEAAARHVDLEAARTHPAVLALSPQRRSEVRLLARLVRDGLAFLAIEAMPPAKVTEVANTSARAAGEAQGVLSRTTVARHMAFLQRYGLIPGVAPAAEVTRAEATRSVALLVRLHPGERDRWHAAAQAAGQAKTATWVREVVEAAVAAQSPPGTSSTATKTVQPAKSPTSNTAGAAAGQVPPALLTALARIGINLNQLVRRVNADARAGREPAAMAKEVARLRAEFVRLRTELTRTEPTHLQGAQQ